MSQWYHITWLVSILQKWPSGIVPTSTTTCQTCSHAFSIGGPTICEGSYNIQSYACKILIHAALIIYIKNSTLTTTKKKQWRGRELKNRNVHRADRRTCDTCRWVLASQLYTAQWGDAVTWAGQGCSQDFSKGGAWSLMKYYRVYRIHEYCICAMVSFSRVVLDSRKLKHLMHIVHVSSSSTFAPTRA